jgi:hypothetical protein
MLATQHPYVKLGEWVVMPNHLHGILVLTDTPRRGGSRTAPTTHDATQTTSLNDAIHSTLPKDTTSPTLNDASKHKPLGHLIGTFKTISTKEINQIRNTPGIANLAMQLLQRSQTSIHPLSTKDRPILPYYVEQDFKPCGDDSSSLNSYDETRK